eukprot:TRINITY_DN23447_c0_g1_i5.p2 TRINITY_DN23447_c0_g1~~TRINITY_DN23447_c0_g1_i5.p2  ORF type:complete len:199 (+),score=6.60 TRINITY_DN23447_c0_g1_i5:303-899(+)
MIEGSWVHGRRTASRSRRLLPLGTDQVQDHIFTTAHRLCPGHRHGRHHSFRIYSQYYRRSFYHYDADGRAGSVLHWIGRWIPVSEIDELARLRAASPGCVDFFTAPLFTVSCYRFRLANCSVLGGGRYYIFSSTCTWPVCLTVSTWVLHLATETLFMVVVLAALDWLVIPVRGDSDEFARLRACFSWLRRPCHLAVLC